MELGVHLIFLPADLVDCPMYWQNFIDGISELADNGHFDHCDEKSDSKKPHPWVTIKLRDYDAVFLHMSADSKILPDNHSRFNRYKPARHVVRFASLEGYTQFMIEWGSY